MALLDALHHSASGTCGVSARLVDYHMTRVGNELEMSKNVLRDTAMEQQPITEACTACTSQHKPRGDMQHLIRAHCQERDSVTHFQSVTATHCRAKKSLAPILS